MGGIGAYPGTFDPPTVAHLAIAEAAWKQGRLERVHLVVSRTPLGKAPAVPSFEDRVAVLEDVAASRPWLEISTTDARLIGDISRDYDAVVMGADKWLQVLDPTWYGGSGADRDRAVASLPPVLLALRPGSPLPAALPPQVTVLDIGADHAGVSSTLARGGRVEWMAPEAARFDRRTGAWSDPARYSACRDSTGPPG
ncbi:MAG: hypothetical protein JO337_12150 [Acidimicrobiales bacterium]|nr:hypothetical protein [Acidimicrobiales bacterium]